MPTVDPSTRQLAFSNVLTAVDGRTGSDAWAVGSYEGPGRHDGKIMLTERWDGTRWSQVATPNVLFFDEKLLAVSAAGANEAWAVGSTNQSGFAGTNPIAAHWNGSAWTIVPTPATTGSAKSILDGAVDFGSSNAWAVGRSRTGKALIEHWDGAAWSIVPSPAPSPPVGTTLAGSVLTGISAVAPTDIWAVGSFSVSSGTTVDTLTLTMHYDGTAWRVVPSPNVAVRHPLNGARQVLGGVEAVRHDDVWAVGNTIDTASGSFLPDKTLILHWNGTAWSVVPSPDSPAEDVLSGVSALSPTDVWAVGQFVDRSGSTPIARTRTLHWNGAAWSVVASPNGPAGDTILNGVSAVPATGEVWAAGFTLASTPGSRTFVLHHGG